MNDFLPENNASEQTGIVINRTNPLNVGSIPQFINQVHIFKPCFL